MEFCDYTVAYLDIMGFKDFVKAGETDTGVLQKLNSLFHEIIPRQISDIKENFPPELEMKCLSCSDSIVVSAPVNHAYSKDYPSLIAVSIKSIQIAHALLDMGLLVRGAIAVGKVYRTESNILGTGYQEAVENEKKACNPQILLTPSAKQNLDEFVSHGDGYKFAIFAKNEHGQVILNSIHPHQSYLPNTKGDINNCFRKYGKTIRTNLSSSHVEPRVRAKWIWFAGLFNANVRYFSDIRDKKAIEIRQDELPGVTLNYLNPPEQNSKCMDAHKARGVTVKINHPSNSEGADL